MLILGLTGSMGMGKSAAAEHFRAHGIAVLDSDAVVHELYRGKAAPLVEAAFPGTTADGIVDRQRLAAALGRDSGAFARLEAIVHPLVREAERAFLAAAAERGAKMAVLEVPLLFETGTDQMCDRVVVVSASEASQRARLLVRPGMTEAKLAQLLSRQMPDAEKRARADFVVDTEGPLADGARQIDGIVAALSGVAGTAYHRHWRS